MEYSIESRNFFQDVYEVVRLIPKGRVTSYGAIARYLGASGSSRMVGWAMNACHTAKPKVPAHRVVNRVGMLTGKNHFTDPNEMERRLKAEKVVVRNDKVLKFNELFWDPSKELAL